MKTIVRNVILHLTVAFLAVWFLTIRACGQDALPDAPIPNVQSDHLQWREPVHHRSWVRRHALAMYFVGLGVGTGLFFYETWPHRCPTVINGQPYDGTICPKNCDPDGCYWGPTAHKTSRIFLH